jgi:hypothetical protein
VRAYPDKLVDNRKAPQNGVIANVNMARQLCIVCKNSIVANLAVMGDMDVGHDPVVIADPRRPGILRSSPVQGAKFPYDIPVANFKSGRFVAIFFVLRCGSYRRELEKPVVCANSGRSLDNDMRADRGIGPYFHEITDYRVGAYRNSWRQTCTRVDDGGWVDRHAFTIKLNAVLCDRMQGRQ